jgi:hypothetical protein
MINRYLDDTANPTLDKDFPLGTQGARLVRLFSIGGNETKMMMEWSGLGGG